MAELRRCERCSTERVQVVSTTRHYRGTERAGSVFQHECFGCGARFVTVTTDRLVAELLPSLFFSLVGIGALAFGVYYGVDLARTYVGPGGGAPVTSFLVPVVAFVVSRYALRVGLLGLRDDVWRPLRAHFKNPRIDSTRSP